MRVWIYDRGGIAAAALFLIVGFFAGLFFVRQVEPLRTLSHDLNHALLGVDDHPERVAVSAVMRATPVPQGQGTPMPGPVRPAPVSVVPAPVGATLTATPGINHFVYTGVPTRLLTLLAPATGKYSLVRYRVPDGEWAAYRPGQEGGQRVTVMPGYEVSITATESFELRW